MKLRTGVEPVLAVTCLLSVESVEPQIGHYSVKNYALGLFIKYTLKVAPQQYE